MELKADYLPVHIDKVFKKCNTINNNGMVGLTNYILFFFRAMRNKVLIKSFFF